MDNRLPAVVAEEIEILKRKLVVLQSCMSIATIRAGGTLVFTQKDFEDHAEFIVTCIEDQAANEFRFVVKKS